MANKKILFKFLKNFVKFSKSLRYPTGYKSAGSHTLGKCSKLQILTICPGQKETKFYIGCYVAVAHWSNCISLWSRSRITVCPSQKETKLTQEDDSIWLDILHK